jgi:DNA-binding ferritin-like protein (Dps family)
MQIMNASVDEEEISNLTGEEIDRYLDEVVMDAVFHYFTEDWFE